MGVYPVQCECGFEATLFTHMMWIECPRCRARLGLLQVLRQREQVLKLAKQLLSIRTQGAGR